MVEYNKAMEKYKDDMKVYDQACVEREQTAKTGYIKEYTMPEPERPIEPRMPQLSDFNEYADVHTTKILREDTLDPIDNAIDKVLKARSILGAQQKRLESAYNINTNTQENLQAAESVIRDADMSELMLEHSQNNILVQSGQAMLGQANQTTQGVLSLLQ